MNHLIQNSKNLPSSSVKLSQLLNPSVEPSKKGVPESHFSTVSYSSCSRK